MHTFAEKPKAPQQATSAKQKTPSQAFFGPIRDGNFFLPLQRTIGNQATQRMLQTDSEAPQAKLASPASPGIGSDFSRVPVHAPAARAIQTKLAINKPGDIYEQEADAVADKVMRMPATQTDSFFQPKPLTVTPVQRKCATCEQEELLQREEEEEEQSVQLKPVKEFDIQRKCAHCEEENRKLQMKAVGINSVGMIAPPVVHDVINSGGQPLDKSTKGFMESRFGYDFNKVQIHNDALAHQSSKDINAHAYTHSNHIAFAAGKYQPNTDSGRRLIAHELTHVVQQTTSGAVLQRQSTMMNVLRYSGVLRHSGRWTNIDSPTVLGLWAKEAAINKLWLEPTLQEVQEHPERVPELVEAVLPKLRAEVYSPKEFYGSPEARKDADEALQARWPLPGDHGIRDQVLEEFVRRYTKQLEQALAHTPEGTELVTRPEEIRRVRYEPYDGIWWHRNQWIRKGQTSPPREILDIKACPKGSEDRCPKGGAPREIWFILKRDWNWIYFSPNQSIDPYDWSVGIVIGQVAESTQFAAELFPYLLELGGFALGLSSRLAVILASEILTALGEQGVRAARGEKMQSALEVVKGIGFGVITTHFLGNVFHESPGRAFEQNLEEATERAATRARVEVARTDASLVERELRAGRARAVEDPDLIADGYRIEVDVTSEGQLHTYRRTKDGIWCRFTGRLCYRREEVPGSKWNQIVGEREIMIPPGKRVSQDIGMKETAGIPGPVPLESGVSGTIGEAGHAAEVTLRLPRKSKKLFSATDILKERDALLRGDITLRELVENFPPEGAAQVFFPTALKRIQKSGSFGGGRFIDHVYLEESTMFVVFRESKKYAQFSVGAKELVQLEKDLAFLSHPRFKGLRIEWRISGAVNLNTRVLLDKLQKDTNGLFRYVLDPVTP